MAMPIPLVNVAWLQANYQAPNVVVVDCRFALKDPHQGRQAYQQGHIPGAFYLDLEEDLSRPKQRHGGRHPLPNLDQLVAKLETLGISSTATAVVAYDSTKGAFAARLWWLLRYLGHDNVSVLDGGLPAWQLAQLPLSVDAPAAPQPAQFSPRIQPDWVVSREQVQSGNPVIDARSPERFRGEQEPIDPVAGSIPGAMNIFWQNNLDNQGYFKPRAQLEQVWAEVPKQGKPIFYCGSGVTACVNALAQVLLEKPMPTLYVGGWSDWCSYDAAAATNA